MNNFEIKNTEIQTFMFNKNSLVSSITKKGFKYVCIEQRIFCNINSLSSDINNTNSIDSMTDSSNELGILSKNQNLVYKSKQVVSLICQPYNSRP